MACSACFRRSSGRQQVPARLGQKTVHLHLHARLIGRPNHHAHVGQVIGHVPCGTIVFGRRHHIQQRQMSSAVIVPQHLHQLVEVGARQVEIDQRQLVVRPGDRPLQEVASLICHIDLVESHLHEQAGQPRGLLQVRIQDDGPPLSRAAGKVNRRGEHLAGARKCSIRLELHDRRHCRVAQAAVGVHRCVDQQRRLRAAVVKQFRRADLAQDLHGRGRRRGVSRRHRMRQDLLQVIRAKLGGNVVRSVGTRRQRLIQPGLVGG